MTQPANAYADALVAGILAERRAEAERARLIRRAGAGRWFRLPTVLSLRRPVFAAPAFKAA